MSLIRYSLLFFICSFFKLSRTLSTPPPFACVLFNCFFPFPFSHSGKQRDGKSRRGRIGKIRESLPAHHHIIDSLYNCNLCFRFLYALFIILVDLIFGNGDDCCYSRIECRTYSYSHSLCSTTPVNDDDNSLLFSSFIIFCWIIFDYFFPLSYWLYIVNLFHVIGKQNPVSS